MVSFEVVTKSRAVLVDVTARVHEAVRNSGVRSGMCFVSIPHTTAAVTVNESYDPDVAADADQALSRLVPARAGYAHSEGNSDAHIKAMLIGACAQVPVDDGELVLGRWQGILFCEFDGPRRRECRVQVVGYPT
jgi:secondary thiamine-phosphate synthase enzyme